MLTAIRYTVWALARLVLALRYRLRVRGLEQVRGLRGPTLVLPNHPGFIDPPPLTPRRPCAPPGPGGAAAAAAPPADGLRGELPDPGPLPAGQAPQRRAGARPGAGQRQGRGHAEEAVRRIIEGLKKGENFIL